MIAELVTLPAWMRRDGRPPRVLVAEAELNTADRLLRGLRLAGFEAVCVHDGRSALVHAGPLAPAAIVVDLLLPRMDGLALAAELRGRPDCAPIPLVALSGCPLRRQWAASVGYARALPKPVVLPELAQALHHLLDRRRSTAPWRGSERRARQPRA